MPMIERSPEDMIVWVEKYRPRKIEDCILPEGIKAVFQGIVKSGKIPNLLLTGSAGVGKTTVARALCNQLGADFILINASLEGNIDTLRTTIKQFASTQSFEGARKVVILDEFDYANPQSFQPALRGFIEEFAHNCSFILTCNFKNKVIAPLHSRCSVIHFEIPKSEKPAIQASLHKRVKEILKLEGVTVPDEVLVEVLTRFFPDIRRMLNELQAATQSGKISSSTLFANADEQFNKLFKALKAKDFGAMRQWIAEHADMDHSLIFDKLYRSLDKFVPESRPEAVIILATGQYQAAFVANPEINLAATLAEIMVRCDLS